MYFKGGPINQRPINRQLFVLNSLIGCLYKGRSDDRKTRETISLRAVKMASSLRCTKCLKKTVNLQFARCFPRKSLVEDCNQNTSAPQTSSDIWRSVLASFENSSYSLRERDRLATQSALIQLSVTETLQLQQPYSEESKKPKEISAKIMEFICFDHQPLSIVEDEGFRKL